MMHKVPTALFDPQLVAKAWQLDRCSFLLQSN
jgi:hypothetical protein